MELRDYQISAIERCVETLADTGIVYLAAETRTGKTAITLSSIEALPGNRRTLFLTKKKAIESIVRDYEDLDCSFWVDVLSHQSAHKANGNYDVIVLDESHSAGAYPKPSLLARKVRLLARAASYVIFLSATPSPESFSSLFHQFWIAGKSSPWSAYPNFYKWAKDYVKVEQKRIGPGVTVNDYSNADKDRIRCDISPYVVSLTQKEAGFRSEIGERELFVAVACEVDELIRELKKDRVIVFDGGLGTVKADTMAKLKSKLHQLSSGTVKLDNGTALTICTAKADAIERDMMERGISKAVIFYKYKEELNAIKSIDWDEITDDPGRFQEMESGVFACQYLSGREGIRLDTADVIYMYSVDFAYLSYEQTKNRIQSFERKTRPEIVWVLSRQGICRNVLSTVRAKKDYTSYYFRRDLKNGF